LTWGPFRIKRSKADKLFSLLIRFRDGWTCQVCHWPADEDNAGDRSRLDCCHFFSRSYRYVRFDPSNAVTACRKCHLQLNGPKSRFHSNFMIARLGEEEYARLHIRLRGNGCTDEVVIAEDLERQLREMGVDPRTGKRERRALR
jgi:hypothetical protein